MNAFLAGLDPCASLGCRRWPGGFCATTRQGIAACACPERCERAVRPVCASDGATYDNLCEMRRAACRRKRADITAKYIGVCGESPHYDFHLQFQVNLKRNSAVLIY